MSPHHAVRENFRAWRTSRNSTKIFSYTSTIVARSKMSNFSMIKQFVEFLDVCARTAYATFPIVPSLLSTVVFLVPDVLLLLLRTRRLEFYLILFLFCCRYPLRISGPAIRRALSSYSFTISTLSSDNCWLHERKRQPIHSTHTPKYPMHTRATRLN